MNNFMRHVSTLPGIHAPSELDLARIVVMLSAIDGCLA